MTPFPLHLLRHGAPDRPGRLLGRSDDAATAEGIAACAARAAGLAVDAIVTSDRRRARACAAAIGPASVDARWCELDFGDWDGLAPDAVDAGALARFHADPDAAPPPSGERWSALVSRVGAAIADLPAAPVLVVTHGGPMRAALHHLCGLSRDQGWAFDLPYAALLSLEVWPTVPRSARITGLRT